MMQQAAEAVRSRYASCSCRLRCPLPRDGAQGGGSGGSPFASSAHMSRSHRSRQRDDGVARLGVEVRDRLLRPPAATHRLWRWRTPVEPCSPRLPVPLITPHCLRAANLLAPAAGHRNRRQHLAGWHVAAPEAADSKKIVRVARRRAVREIGETESRGATFCRSSARWAKSRITPQYVYRRRRARRRLEREPLGRASGGRSSRVAAAGGTVDEIARRGEAGRGEAGVWCPSPCDTRRARVTRKRSLC